MDSGFVYDDLGPFADGIKLWSRMIATADVPELRGVVWRNCVLEGAQFVAKGAPLGLVAAELIERAERHKLIAELGGLEAVETIVADGLAGKPAPEPPISDGRAPRFKLIPFAELKPGKETNYLVKGIIPRHGLVVVWGPPKCGKSFWTFDLAMHVALNWNYRGHRTQQGSVVYCAFEGADGFRARAEAFRRQHAITEAPLFLVPAVLDLFNDHRQLIHDIRVHAVSPAIVVLDTLNRSLVGSESNDQDMAKYVRAADTIREAFKCVVIIVHHCGINETRPRGHTSLTGAADAQLAVKRDEQNNIVVTVEWMKDGPEGEIIRNRLELVELGCDEDGDAITSLVVRPVENDGFSMSVPKKEPKISPQAKQAFRMLCEVLNDHGTAASANTRIPFGTRTIPDNHWREYYYANTIGEPDKPDSKRKAFSRAVEQLQAAEMIGIWQGFVWLPDNSGHART